MSNLQPPAFLPPVLDDNVQPAGDLAWDRWEKYALAEGLTPKLAAMGRALIREAYQHGWPERLKNECGWIDSGARMLQFALTEPRLAEIRWRYLLESGGDLHWSMWGSRR